MGYLHRRPFRIPVILFMSAVILLGIFAPAAAAPSQTTSTIKFTVEFNRLSPPPFTQTNIILVNLTAYQTPKFVFGTIDVVDVFRNVRIHGFITSLTKISGGFQFSGCGRAGGSVKTRVCFFGAGQDMGEDAPYDLFSIGLSQGGTYTISGHVPPASVLVVSP